MNKLLASYRDEWNFFQERLARTFYLLCGLFVIVMLIALLFFRLEPAAAQKAAHWLIARFEERPGALHIQSFRFFIVVVTSNFLVSFISLLLGLTPFFILPTLSLFRTGFYLAAFVHIVGSTSVLTLFAGILPHGIIEIPACIYAACLGVQLSRSNARDRNRMMTVDSVRMEAVNSLEFSRVLRSYTLIVIPSLILAALIETFVTPLIMSMTIK